MARNRRMGLRKPPSQIRRGGLGVPVEKAAKGGSVLPGGLALPAGGIATDATGMLQSIQAQTANPQYVDTTNRPLPRDDFWAMFGPGAPLYPAPLNPADPDTGQAAPRRWEYAVSWNLQFDSQKLVDWATLRKAAESVDIIRRCIEIRKAEIVQMQWDITPSRRAMQRAGANTPAEKAAMREKYAAHIERAVAFWQKPDQQNDLSFSDWIAMLLEEYFAVDAVSIYPRVNYGRELHSLNLIDGTTIKPLLDPYGNTPAAPAPAYQQYLWGFPRGEYTATGNADFDMDAGSLLYKPRHRRTWTPYGYSPTEQALVSADIYLRRQGWMREEYTSGTLPTAFLETDLSTNLTPEQIRAWETSLNDFYEGSGQNRHRFRLLPNGFHPTMTQDAAERYKPDYDEFLITILATHFDVMPDELGITPRTGLGGAGHAEGQENTKYRSAIRPLCEWLTDILDSIGQRYLGLPPELTFSWLGMEAQDEESADKVASDRVSTGRMTVNEDRDRIGLPRYPGEWADQPMMTTGSGPVWLGPAFEDVTAPPAPVPAPLVGQQPGARPPAGAPPGEELDEEPVKDQADSEAAKAEMDAFRRFITKRGKLTRPFKFEHVDAEYAAELNNLAEYDIEKALHHARPENAVYSLIPRLVPSPVNKANGGGGARGRGESSAGRTGLAGPSSRRRPAHGGYRSGFDWAAPEP